MMRFVSTRRDASQSWSLHEAVFMGYAPDGGMFMPETIPQISREQWEEWSRLYLDDPANFPLFHRIAVDVLCMFIEESDLSRDSLTEIIQEIKFPIFVTHLHSQGDKNTVHRSNEPDFAPTNISWTSQDKHILELCNGPTFTFKDIGMQFLGRLMGVLLKSQENPHKITIIVATSGDTGSAAIEAVQNHPLIELFVLYPGNGRISNLQERQMATNTASNVHCIRFDGTSDDADVIVTELFAREELRPFFLTTLNSVNMGRILMQTIPFIFAYVQTMASQIQHSVKAEAALPKICYSIPTGGLGNGSSCYMAKCMGLPVENIVLAVNENDTISRTLSSGVFQMKPVKVTNAPAMDICNPYNIERLIYLMSDNQPVIVKDFIATQSNGDGVSMDKNVLMNFQRYFESYSIDQKEVCEEIKEIFDRWKVIVDPHSAVGLRATKRIQNKKMIPTVCVSTAHAAKFPETIEAIIQQKLILPECLQSLLDQPLLVLDLPLGSMVNQLSQMIAKNFNKR